MADQTIITSDDTYLDETANTLYRYLIDNLQHRVGTGLETNPVLRFDVSSLTGMVWDSVVLRMTYKANSTDISVPATVTYVSYVLKAASSDFSTTNWDDYDTGLTWGTSGAETSDDNDHTTRVTWPLVGDHVADEQVETPDLTDIVNKAINENSGDLALIVYSLGSNGNVQRFYSLESAGVTDDQKAHLFFSNVQAAPSTTPDTVSPTVVGFESTKSSRPPVEDPGRQTTVTILHDGVMPMTLLSLIVKAEYGTDA